MSEGQYRLGLLLAVVLLGLTGLLYFWEPADPLVDEDETALVWDVEADLVRRVEVDRPQGRLVLEKVEGSWNLVEPYAAPADTWKARDLVNDLTDIERGIPIPEADPAQFGLGDPPAAKVVLTLTDDTTRELRVGRQAPAGFRSYVQGADGGIVAVPGSVAESVVEPADEFRDKRVMRFAIPKVTAVKVTTHAGVLSLLEDDAGQWWLEGFTRADPQKVEDLLLDLLDLRLDATADAATLPDTSAVVVVVTLDDGSTQILTVGEPEMEGAPVRGEIAGWVSPERLTFLGRGPVDVGDQQAFPVDRTALERVEVSLGGASWTLERVDDAWQRDGTEEPGAGAALDALAAADIDYGPDPVPPISEPYGTIVLKTGAGERVIDVGQVHGDWRIAKDRAGGQPYLVPTDDIDAVRTAL